MRHNDDARPQAAKEGLLPSGQVILEQLHVYIFGDPLDRKGNPGAAHWQNELMVEVYGDAKTQRKGLKQLHEENSKRLDAQEKLADDHGRMLFKFGCVGVGAIVALQLLWFGLQMHFMVNMKKELPELPAAISH